MKTYVLIISREFPATHPRKSGPTYFDKKILLALMRSENKNLSVKATTPQGEELQPKLHTIRANYELWKNRAEKINAGKAVLSIRYWTGKPYNSKQVEISRLTEIGIQKIEFDDYLYTALIEGKRFGDMDKLMENDGLNEKDFEDWFVHYDFSKPMVIIHFTKFRY